MHPVLKTTLKTIQSSFAGKKNIHSADIPLAGKCLITLSCAINRQHTVLFVADTNRRLEEAHQDISSLIKALLPQKKGLNALFFPPWEDSAHDDMRAATHRLHTLQQLASQKPASSRPLIVTTCIQALMQKVKGPENLITNTLHLKKDTHHDMIEVVSWFEKQNYTFSSRVEEPGQVAVRGGLIDVWPVTGEMPVRIDFDGQQIDDLRTFNPVNQRTAARIQVVNIPPKDEAHNPGVSAEMVSLFDYLADNSMIVWSTSESIEEHALACEQNARETATGELFSTLQTLRILAKQKHFVQIAFSELDHADEMSGFSHVNDVFKIYQRSLHPDALESSRQNLMKELQHYAEKGYKIVIFFNTEGSLNHFRQTAGENASANISFQIGTLSGGVVSLKNKIIIIAESDIYGKKETIGQRYYPHSDQSGQRAVKRIPRTRAGDLSLIEPGDLVVHSTHGIGRYLGLNEITIKDRWQETLTVEYAEGSKLYVPVSQSHLLTKYIGTTRKIKLHRLGGARWKNEKNKAEEAILDFAAELLETQAKRSTLEGYSFSPDTPWQCDFDNSFPFRETEDQQRVISEVKSDMESTKPMDRLICGDAGYGKTEIAIRASFKAAMDTKQTAILVPTTILAQQHYNTFSERMASFPVRIEMLSRFLTKSQQHSILKELAEGKVDIIIGTHALLQREVKFKDLGLVIIDEEQRFGVGHKEQLKHVRQMVDVLTMTATPIPRTLYLSMSGVRDMSLVQTPPQERIPIETIVNRDSNEMIREIIMRELGRDGQVFFLHNRVRSIEKVRKRLELLVPEAQIKIGHGQMGSHELENVMRDFVKGEFNVLVCTTIIESGMDIPRANTIIINHAEKFGLADLYQLRGRVGRSTHKGYACLLIPSHESLDSDARRKINAIKRHSGLSAGFYLAMRDLEIRGAGNILGSRQSGHIKAIGFGLYCQMLKRSVAQLRNEPIPPILDVHVRLDFLELAPSSPDRSNAAFVPYEYIEEEQIRLEVYRKIAELSSQQEVRETRSEFRDRFGPVPPQVERLLKITELKIAASEQQISNIEARNTKLILTRNNEYIKKGSRFPRLTESTPDKMLEQIIRLIKSA